MPRLLQQGGSLVMVHAEWSRQCIGLVHCTTCCQLLDVLAQLPLGVWEKGVSAAAASSV